MFRPDTSLELPTGCDLLAEIGVDRHTVREVAEDERAIRCPERGAVYPGYGFTSLFPEPASGTFLRDAAFPDRCPGQAAEPRDPASSLPPADERWRRA